MDQIQLHALARNKEGGRSTLLILSQQELKQSYETSAEASNARG